MATALEVSVLLALMLPKTMMLHINKMAQSSSCDGYACYHSARARSYDYGLGYSHVCLIGQIQGSRREYQDQSENVQLGHSKGASQYCILKSAHPEYRCSLGHARPSTDCTVAHSRTGEVAGLQVSRASSGSE
ncbi:hypothetical protein NDU88_003622 [Pleurodeles waltl]|uniref:Secreted protein n=1 Tax=Pleurodeles waltl TaxID=8319 RepID=A0AAV7TQA8_PLEWA|nr:hypothetical protein NDU88_003622 [Pleurodeles waltl]